MKVSGNLPKNKPIYPPIFPLKVWMSTYFDYVITFISSGYFMKILNVPHLYLPNSYLIFEIRWQGFRQGDDLGDDNAFALPDVILDICVLSDRLHRGSETFHPR